MKEIQLTQGKVALVDDAEYDYLMQWRWFAHKAHGGKYWYAERSLDKYNSVSMHRQLCDKELTKKLVVDHENGNGLDNRRHNLRAGTVAQNGRNRKLGANNTSGYKGVSWHQTKWEVRIQVAKKTLCLGQFKQLIDAAVAYDQAAQIHHGAFAKLNFSYDPACFI